MAQDAPMTHDELQLAIFLLGPWMIGSCLDFVLQGVLFSQFIRYFTTNNNDRPGLKLMVVGLVILTTLKSIHSFGVIWIMLILHFKNLRGAILLNYTTWWQTGSSLMVASIGIYVQSFFCYRLWVISKKRTILVPIVAVLIFAYISICLATFYITKGEAAGPKIATWFAAHLSSVFAGDLMITLSTAYFLLKVREEVLPQTVGIVTALIRLTFQTAAPAALCAMFNLIFSQVYTGDQKLISTGFNQVLPKLYAFSMMWTLNARQEIRAQGRPGKNYNLRALLPYSDPNSITSNKALHVHTSTEVTTEYSVRHMFHPGPREVKSATSTTA